MINTLFSTGCPKCKVLIKKLESKNIEFEINNNIDEMLSLGLNELPVLRVEDKMLNFKEAVDWINERV